MNELLAKLQALDLEGEFTIEDGEIIWYYSIDGSCDDPQDLLWSVKCDVGQEVDKVLPPEFQRQASDADNDSTWFTITKTEPKILSNQGV